VKDSFCFLLDEGVLAMEGVADLIGNCHENINWRTVIVRMDSFWNYSLCETSRVF
jgi:hypothetical protein